MCIHACMWAHLCACTCSCKWVMYMYIKTNRFLDNNLSANTILVSLIDKVCLVVDSDNIGLPALLCPCCLVKTMEK